MIIKVMSSVTSGGSTSSGGSGGAQTTALSMAGTTAAATTTATTTATPKPKAMQLSNGFTSTAMTATTNTTATSAATTTTITKIPITTTSTITATSTSTTTSSTKTAEAISAATATATATTMGTLVIKKPTITTASLDKDNKNASELCKNTANNKDKLEMLLLTPVSDKKSNAKSILKQDTVNTAAAAAAPLPLPPPSPSPLKPVAVQVTQKALTSAASAKAATTTTTTAAAATTKPTNSNQIKSETNATTEIAFANAKRNGMQKLQQLQQQQQQQHSQQNVPTSISINSSCNNNTKEGNKKQQQQCTTATTNANVAQCDNIAIANNNNNNNNNNNENNNNNNTNINKKQHKANTNTNTNTNLDIINSIKHECDQNVEIKSEDSLNGTNANSSSNSTSTTAVTTTVAEELTTGTATPTPPPPPPPPTPATAAATATHLTDTSYSSDSLISAKRRPVLLSLVNPHIMCNLCNGYLIDATTIVECLHSFCHSCLIKHLRTENYCPRCEMMINTAKPNIKPDTTLQAIVYKLVPGLYERELMRKRAFYKDRPEEAASATPEQRGDDTEHLIFSPSDYMSLSLEYADLDQLMGTSHEYGELLKPRYLQCPAMYTVGHLKKFVYGKFEIDHLRFNIDIMYKVKTIVLLDHYTLMDVAYIYTWKRDAPMRFYFRVKESLRPQKPVKKIMIPLKTESENSDSHLSANVMTVVHKPALPNPITLLQPDEIKVENDEDQPISNENARFEIVANSLAFGKRDEQSTTDPLKITIVNKNSKEKHVATALSNRTYKEKKDSTANTTPPERKVENIKLKIDLSKQNSVTIINMSDPDRKQIVKPVRPEKEWKVKSKRQDKESSASPKSNGERKIKTPSPLTVPPLTIKAGRISPLTKSNSYANSESLKSPTLTEDIKKSDFLKSFALEPIRSKPDSPEKVGKSSSLPATNLSPKSKDKKVLSPVKAKSPTDNEKLLMKPPIGVAPKAAAASKRKSKEPVKAIAKKPKLSIPFATPIDAFKIKLPAIPKSTTETLAAPTSTTPKIVADKPHMPPPLPVTAMRPPSIFAPKKQQKSQHKYVAAAGSLTPHPMHAGLQLAAPGNRTPIAKRYQPILPKAVRPNPFANIPSDVNKILKDAGTEIKSISNDSSSSKVYGPKHESNTSVMGPPPTPTTSSAINTSASTKSATTSNLQRNHNSPAHKQNNHSSSSPNNNNNNNNKTTSYLNLALFNASKSKGNEVPPGCRTPMYTPNSPIYSPSSPQYAPNYTIPTMPSYKYTPKPSNANNYLQNVLGTASSQLASLFPSPPTRKDGTSNSTNSSTKNVNNNNNIGNSAKTENSQLGTPKRVYPFARSPSPIEDPPEKQLKVKSLLNSCNINIPSSLSITITREDSESQSNNSSYPKHKSPVNNYIEILKLPEQPFENEAAKRASPPVQKTTTTASTTLNHLASMRKDISDLKPIPSPQHLIARISQAMSQNNKPSGASVNGNNNSNNNINNSNQNTHTNGIQNAKQTVGMLSSLTASTANTAQSVRNNSPTSALSQQQQQQQQQQHKSPQSNGIIKTQNQNQKSVTSPTAADKKTPSPEKRSPLGSNSGSQTSPPSENKSPKSPNSGNDAAAQAAKKFRHILPRQNTMPIAEVVPPKVTTANIVGTYSSPSGIAVKIHANKKVPPTKKSPNSIASAGPKLQMNGGNVSGVLTPQGSPNLATATPSTAKSTPSPKSSPLPPTNGNVNQNNQNNSNMNAKTTMKSMAAVALPSPPLPVAPGLASPNAMNKLLPHPALTAAAMPNHLPHPIQMMGGLTNMSPHLGIASAANQAELNKFLKDNLLRAQVQAAAAANQSNMFYSAYAANAAAAQMSQFAPSMYNYQQAYLMEQFSRMQRAGSEAFTEYMQKLKNGIDATKATTADVAPNDGQKTAAITLSATSPKNQLATTASQTAKNNNNNVVVATKGNTTSKAK